MPKIRNKGIKSNSYTGISNDVLRATNLNHTHFRILVVLNDYTNGHKFTKSSLARRCNMERTTIQKNWKQLIKMGWIVEYGDDVVLKKGCGSEQQGVLPKTAGKCCSQQHPSDIDIKDKHINGIEIGTQYHKQITK